MIVVDASLIVEILTGSAEGLGIARQLEDADEEALAPELLDLEVLQSLRRRVHHGMTDDVGAQKAFTLFRTMPIARQRHEPLLGRIWELRHNATSYDATYLALAEALPAPLWTCDTKFSGTPGHGVEIRYFKPAPKSSHHR